MMLAVLLVCSLVGVQGAYRLNSNFSGSGFFNNFNFFTGADPTHGYVYYATKDQALSWGYASAPSGAGPVYIGADHSSVSSGSGRGSVRLTSIKAWTKGLFIIDLSHMPVGCGTWPAFWTVGPNWPYSGEIDIIEGVHNQNYDQSTLHTGPGCTVGSDKTKFSGSLLQSNCNAPGNTGCGIASGANFYGTPFNNNGGGVYAMEWTDSYIQTFYFPRNGIPSDIANGNPVPSNWGKPYAYFQLGSACPSTFFANHNIVIDLTFCGDWAGDVFSAQCPNLGTCASYVQNNPSAFANAYWLINYIKVYQL